mgnify:FL=1
MREQRLTLKKVWRYIRPHRVLLLLSLVLALVSVFATLSVPILVGRAIDCMVGIGSVDFEGIAHIVLQILVLIGAAALSQWLMQVMHNRITYHVVQDMRNAAFERLQHLPLKYLDAHPAGEIVSRIITDAEQFADGLLMGFSQLFTGVMTILGTIGLMVSLHPLITLVVILVTPLSLFLSKYISGKTFHMFREQSAVRGDQTALIEERVGNLKLLQAMGQEEKSQEQFDALNEKLRTCSLKAIFFSSLTNPSTRFINALSYAAVGLIGAFAVIDGGLTVGAFSSLLSYANQYAKPFNEVTGVITELQNAIACAARVFELLEQETEKTPAEARTLPLQTGTVSIEDVQFSYTPERPLIEHFSLEVQTGQRIAIVGPTGCGKTTLINLLMRFYDVGGGVIRMDGTDIRAMQRTALRHSIGMVLQDTWLMTGTVRENIALGRPDATMEQVAAAAKAAFADGFIRQLPQGYDTVLQSDNEMLSQGQKQLLSIARIMLCEPTVLILDEATSSIDTRTEVKIQEAFEKLMVGKTSFVVAHRLSTIVSADKILVMKDGNIIESGTHRELLEKNGFYTHLYKSQFAGSAN